MKRAIFILTLSLILLPFTLAGIECFDAVSQTTIQDAGYTYLDSNLGKIGVQVRVGNHPSTFEIVGVDVAVSAGGVTRVITKMIAIGQNEEKALTFYDIAFKDASSATISLAPIIKVNNTQQTCDISSSILVNTITPSTGLTGVLVPVAINYEFTLSADGAPKEPYAMERVLLTPLFENQGMNTIPKEEMLNSLPTFDLEDFVMIDDIHWVPNGGYWNPTYSAGLAPGQRARVWMHGYFKTAGNKNLVMRTSEAEYTTPFLILDDPGCFDSDGGKDEFVKGWTIGSNYRSEDECRGNEVLEFYCDESGNGRKYTEMISCPLGCSDGACSTTEDVTISEEELSCTWPRGCCETSADCSTSAPYCVQSAAYEGPNIGRGVCSPGQAGHYCDKSQGSEDCRTSLTCNINCGNYGELSWCSPMYAKGEVTVDEGIRCNSCNAVDKICATGGSNQIVSVNETEIILNLTLSGSNETEIPPTSETEIPPTTETPSYPETTEVNACRTCLIGEACFPFGYRKDGNYCNADELNFTQYKESEESCENNFECKSNLCIDNECISGNLFRRIANWFRRVFGEQ